MTHWLQASADGLSLWSATGSIWTKINKKYTNAAGRRRAQVMSSGLPHSIADVQGWLNVSDRVRLEIQVSLNPCVQSVGCGWGLVFIYVSCPWPSAPIQSQYSARRSFLNRELILIAALWRQWDVVKQCLWRGAAHILLQLWIKGERVHLTVTPRSFTSPVLALINSTGVCMRVCVPWVACVQ